MTDATIKRKSICEYFLLLADSIKLSSPYWALIKTDLPKVNYHWFSCDSWRPKEPRYVWGRSVECLGLIAGVSFPRLTPPSVPYFSHSLAVSFTSRKVLETPATQATR